MTTTIATFAQGEGLHRSRTVPKEPTTPNPTATLQRTARIHTTVTQDTCGDLFFSPSSVARAAAVWHITSLCWGIGREIVKGGRMTTQGRKLAAMPAKRAERVWGLR